MTGAGRGLFCPQRHCPASHSGEAGYRGRLGGGWDASASSPKDLRQKSKENLL
ncbi:MULTISPECIES: hypothetical protein [unclassified Mesorhizobium]|uniref:hypothetical protein n=1 Tax=unclassified Mesorhizobium TaxID=325217 RepID=UPI0012E9BD1C|nr:MULTISPECIES: hypothetical protein [unclassified Mesorhizobium]QIA25530.1 hypothetical protein A9K68_030375 [Mesorhizobium sp. AA22]